MKILHITPRYYPAIGGIEKYFKVLSEYFAKNHEVMVWTSDAFENDALWDVDRQKCKNLNEEINGVEVERFPVAPGLLKNKWINKGFRVFLIRSPFRFTQYLSTPPTVLTMLSKAKRSQELDFDIVHAGPAPFNILFHIGVLAADKTNAKFIMTTCIHLGTGPDDPIRKIYLKPASLNFYKRADAIIVQTDFEKAEIKKFAEENGTTLNDDKFVKLGLGIFPEELSGGDGQRFRKKYKLGDIPIVLYLGAKVKDKGVFNLVRASERVWKSGEKFKLVLAGNRTKEFDQFWASCSDSAKENILMFDYIEESEKLDLLDACDLFSMISKSDSYGIVYLEAWTYKKPVLACNTPVFEEIVDDGVDGKLVKFDDIDQIAGEIKELLNNPEQRKNMGESGYKKVMENHTWKSKLKLLEDLYMKLGKEEKDG
jgi:glycosyltransferase involved in cell wall biosynthesis